MAVFPTAFVMPGVNLLLWSGVGLLRFISEDLEYQLKKRRVSKGLTRPKGKESLQFINPKAPKISPKQVATIIPARNEELVIAKTIEALKIILPPQNIYVASDGSNDRTAAIAKNLGVQALEIFPNRGKAGAIEEILNHFKLLDRFELIFFVDADTQIDKNFLKVALPYFDDPHVACFFGFARTIWKSHILPRLSMFYIAYRDRLYTILGYTIRYGQTWKWTNYTHIVPGFASIYRSRVLAKMTLNPPGLIIEDFNFTFELQRKKLGLITHHPSALAYDQDPDNFSDYFRQVVRWTMGFWQVVRRHGVWPSFFWGFLILFLIEVYASAIFFLLLPFLLFILFAPGISNMVSPWVINVADVAGRVWSITDIIIGIFILDYLFTVVVAILHRRPLLLFYGLFFPILRYVDGLAFFYGMRKAFTQTSKGSWIPATRRKN